MRPITVIGIDPGANGALCFASSEKKDIELKAGKGIILNPGEKQTVKI